MTTRRGFLTGMLALGAAPAIVRAESLMRLWVPPQELLVADWILDDRYYRGNVGHPADTYLVFIPYADDPLAQRGMTLAEAARYGWYQTDSGMMRHG